MKVSVFVVDHGGVGEQVPRVFVTKEPAVAFFGVESRRMNNQDSQTSEMVRLMKHTFEGTPRAVTAEAMLLGSLMAPDAPTRSLVRNRLCTAEHSMEVIKLDNSKWHQSEDGWLP